MLKLVLLTLGWLILAPMVSSSQAATFPTRPKLHQIDRELHVQKLVPIKKSSNLRTTVNFKTPATPRNKKVELSTENKENQRIKTECQKEIESRQQFGSNERPLSVGENPKDSNKPNSLGNFSNISSSLYSRSCNFSVPFK